MVGRGDSHFTIGNRGVQLSERFQSGPYRYPAVIAESLAVTGHDHLGKV
jgi:hypothetical protein